MPCVVSPVPVVVALEPVDSTGTPSSTTNDQDAPSPKQFQDGAACDGWAEDDMFQDIEVAHLDNDPFFGVLIPEPNSEESSSSDDIPTNSDAL
ncbi:hypothetical protein Tco_0478870 [Tanacetum coccineum]